LFRNLNSNKDYFSKPLSHSTGGNFYAHIYFKNERKRKMRILYINNTGSGWADYIDVPQNQTVEELFKGKMPGSKPDDFLIRVNRQPVAKDQILRENDRVTITPLKIEGAII